MRAFDLYVTDQDGDRLAVIDEYESAEVITRANDVSTWQLTLPTDTKAGQVFLSDLRARVEFVLLDDDPTPGYWTDTSPAVWVPPVADDVVWSSGPVSHLQRTVDVDGDMLQMTGSDDTIWLAWRNAHPQPGTPAPPYSTTAYDVHTGAVTTVLAELARVNAGPSAVPLRRVAGLTVPVPIAAGPTVTVSSRWQNLLTLMQDTARPAGILFDIVGLTFRTFPATNRGAIFSAGLETLAGWTVTAEAPKANFVVVAGQGEGAARLIREQSDAGSISTWGRAEAFQDRRDTASTTELDLAGQETLAASVAPVTVVFMPVDTDAQKFGRDWTLGDIVTVKAGDLTVVDQIREVHLTLDDDGATVVPSVGAPAGDLALFRSLAGLDRRVRQLERI